MMPRIRPRLPAVAAMRIVLLSCHRHAGRKTQRWGTRGGVPGSEWIGCRISFTRHFSQPAQLRALAQVEADIHALKRETDGLLAEILVTTEN